jgi:cytochrome P450
MKKSIAKDEPIPVFFAYRCLTVDIICEYLFGKQNYLVDLQDWGMGFYTAWRSLFEMAPLVRQFPSMLTILRLMPRWLLVYTSPKAVQILDMEQQTARWTHELLDSDPEEVEKRQFKVVLWEVAHSKSLPPSERSAERLAVDGNNLLSAGFETTGTSLSHLTYGILNNPAIHRKLLKELEEAIPDPNNMPSFQALEKLPYLHAVVKEGIR